MKGITYQCGRCGAEEEFRPARAFLTVSGRDLVFLWDCTAVRYFEATETYNVGPIRSRIELAAALNTPAIVDPDAEDLIGQMLAGVA